MSFPKGFVWGAAAAAHQIEGAYNEDGRGLDVWDVFEAEPGKIFDGHTARVACDHYHRYEDDIKIMKEIGLKNYRLSISWSRLLPGGTGAVNRAGVDFYKRLLNALCENGIEPYITLYHWDLPHELFKRGGWLNPESPDWFGEYAELAAKSYSEFCRHFITFNEPQCFIGLGFQKGVHAPALKCAARDVLEMTHNVLKAHGTAVRAAKAAADVRLGYAPTGEMCCPLTESAEDIEAARRQMFSCPPLENCADGISWWSDPIMLGKYPEEGLEKYKGYLPDITDDDMKLISEPIDFYCQNIYNGAFVKAGENSGAEYVKRPVGGGKTAIGWPITPQSLCWGPKFLYERYKKPIYITENGMSSHDWIALDGAVHDPQRIDYTRLHLRELEKAIADGADVRGYFHWSIMDNFEWCCGYSERFGLVCVDYQTQKRIIKDSGRWYREVIETNGGNI